MDRDVALLFVTRAIRMFGYGLLSVVLVLYLTALGMSAAEVGLLLALTLLGDAAVSLWLTTHADRIGRRRVLVAGAGLMLAAGFTFVATPIYAVLVVAATIGVISPSGNEVGPFLAVEQASLSQVVGNQNRTSLLAKYQLVGSFATAVGALAGGGIAQLAITNPPAKASRAKSIDRRRTTPWDLCRPRRVRMAASVTSLAGTSTRGETRVNSKASTIPARA